MTLRKILFFFLVLVWQSCSLVVVVASWSMNRRQIWRQSSAIFAPWFTIVTTDVVPAKAETDPSDWEQGPRGLQYKILRPGQGESAIRGQQVYAKYTLWTGGFEARQVDSNTGFLGRPLPVIVGIGRVIKGWDLTLLEMKVGEIRRVIVPSEIGYGDKGAVGTIPPKATLYFEMELTGMDSLPQLTDAQQQWLNENPI